MSVIDAKKILIEVRANLARLAGCVAQSHNFVPCEFVRGTQIPRRHECTVCHGTLDAVQVRWYQTGVEHGRRSQ